MDLSLDQINLTGLLIMVFVMRNQIAELGRRVTKLEDKE